jgi:hypothetical protein
MRPRLAFESIVIRTAISLRPGEDDDLIAFFEKIPPRKFSAAIKTAMRSGSLLDFGAELGQDEDDLAQSLADFMD